MEYIRDSQVLIMEEKESLLEKGVLQKIESRLNNLESNVQQILAKGDEFNEATQEKLENIQEQLEKQTQNMRKLRRKLMDRYNPYTIFTVLVVVVVIWILFMYYVVGK
tara:strand:+ start:1222 stop:1545 length:324 start_codon:yes stop_codon:yes gene_type:complete